MIERVALSGGQSGSECVECSPLSCMAFESNDIYNERKIFNSIKYTKKDHGINP